MIRWRHNGIMEGGAYDCSVDDDDDNDVDDDVNYDVNYDKIRPQ